MEEQRKTAEEVPPQEVSLHEALQRQQVMDRNFEAKLLALKRGKQEYDLRLQELNKYIERSDQMAQDLERKRQEAAELTTQENLATVVAHLQAVQPQQAKEELLRWMNDGRMDDAILLMNKIPEGKLKKILQKFVAPDEQTKLYELHQRVIDRGEQASSLDQAIDDLKATGAGQ
jgi:hypothetical protein